ncbi:MAG TPA: ABC transporter permease [Terriglobia bacterium]|nr:ABC transporter permease [Terriglobia bacterium]
MSQFGTMRFFYKLPLRLRSLFRRNGVEQELSDELGFHLEADIAQRIAEGMTPEEARYTALRELGGVEQIKEECRDMRRVNFIDNLIQDVRYGFRMLAKSPGFTAVVILSLALGIGANTAIFTLLNAIVLKALPVQHPEELVQFSETYPNGSENSFMSWPEFERIHDRNRTLSGAFAFTGIGRVNVVFEGKAGLAAGQLATGEYFSTLCLIPAAGHFFTDEDDKAKRPVAVISYRLWQRRFAGDFSIIGRAITVNQVPLTVIGITPAPFFGLEVGDSPDITAPMTLLGQLTAGQPDWEGAFDTWLEIMGRLRQGATRQQAQAEFSVIYHQFLTDYAPTAGADQRQSMARMLEKARLNVKVGTQGFKGGLRRDFSLPLQIVMIMVGIVLLVACANVANLLLARATSRQREIAVRLAIGAGRARLIRQLLTESILLAGAGGVLGLVVAGATSHLLLRMVSTGDSPMPVDLTPDLRVLAFAAGVSLLTGILFGLAPALRATRVDLTPSLKEGRSQFGGQNRRRTLGLDRMLVTAQIALSLTLLVGAGLFIRSLQRLWAINPGYDRNNLLMFSLDPRLAGYKENGKLAGLYTQMLSDLRTLPGVRSASLSLVRPVDDEAYWVNGIIAIDGRKLAENENIHIAVNAVGPSYFANLGTPMLLGREFGPVDDQHSPQVAIINEILARRCFGDKNPIGHRLARHGGGEFRIVGVVKDSRYGGVKDAPPGVLYQPFFQLSLADVFFSTTFEVQYSGGLSTTLDEVRRQVRSIDPTLPLFRVNTLEAQTRDSFVKERLIATLSTLFGSLALLLACIGLYGTIAYGVTRRTGEIGVRMALGAERANILRMVLRESMTLVALGIIIGVPAALATSRLIATMLYGVKPTDPLTIVTATAVLAGVALLAGYLPSRRASRVDPMVALRYE